MALPEAPRDISTEFFLFTPTTTSDIGKRIPADNLKRHRIFNRLDTSLKLTIIIHGFLQNGRVSWVREMRKELMQKERMNIMVVNWELGCDALSGYHAAAGNTRLVGAQIAKLIGKLHRRYNYDLSKIHVIGHSLGAHVAGFAGAKVTTKQAGKKLGRITAPRHYLSVTLHDLRFGYQLLDVLISKKIIIRLTNSNGNKMSSKQSYVENVNTNQSVSRLLISDLAPGSLTSISILYHGRPMYVGRVTIQGTGYKRGLSIIPLPPLCITYSLIPYSAASITQFNLFTRRNGLPEIISDRNLSANSSSFNPKLKLTFIIHGYLQHGRLAWVGDMRRELMKREIMNIVVVDWGRGSGLSDFSYNTAVQNTRLVAAHIAKLIGKLHRIYNYDLSKIHVIGHSLGAHVAGFVGAKVTASQAGKKLGRITDLFSPANMVTKFINIGNSKLPLIWQFVCNHMKVLYYFTASINNNCSRKAFPCRTWKAFKRGRCFDCRGACAEMGYNADQHYRGTRVSRKYYLKTLNSHPYCAPRYYHVTLYGLRFRFSYSFGFGINEIKIRLKGKNGVIMVSNP
ncbi:hypothetical protein QZH41_019265, partial [Actinostola sp. cb2023]